MGPMNRTDTGELALRKVGLGFRPRTNVSALQSIDLRLKIVADQTSADLSSSHQINRCQNARGIERKEPISASFMTSNSLQNQMTIK